jgi:hypothetical protein
MGKIGFSLSFEDENSVRKDGPAETAGPSWSTGGHPREARNRVNAFTRPSRSP